MRGRVERLAPRDPGRHERLILLILCSRCLDSPGQIRCGDPASVESTAEESALETRGSATPKHRLPRLDVGIAIFNINSIHSAVVVWACPDHASPSACPDACPWCGSKLPTAPNQA